MTKEQEQRAVKVLAEMEGLEVVLDKGNIWIVNEDELLSPPPYLTSKDALTPIIEGLTEDQGCAYVDYLFEAINGYQPNFRDMCFDELVAIQKAKAGQIAEALIRMAGKWEYVLGTENGSN